MIYTFRMFIRILLVLDAFVIILTLKTLKREERRQIYVYDLRYAKNFAVFFNDLCKTIF